MNVEDLQARCPPGWTATNLQGDEVKMPLYRFSHRNSKYAITLPWEATAEQNEDSDRETAELQVSQASVTEF